MPGAAPLFATRPEPGWTDGAQIALIGEALGTPFLPWQRYAADIVGARLPDGTPRYRVVVISVPRQSGKTTLLRAIGVHSCLVTAQDVFYTAQTGKDARARWRDLVKQLETSASLQRVVRAYRSAGSERVLFTPTDSSFHAFAPTPESLHGYTPPKVMIDEAFAFGEEAGDALMGAITPAQITLPQRQLLIVSTRGTVESVFLARWITRAMEGAPRVAGMLWGAADDDDPYSLDDIKAFHPAIGYRLNGQVLTAQDILDEAERNPAAEYERGYANRTTVKATPTVPAELWRPLRVDDELAPPPRLEDLVLSYDVDHDGKSSTIMASWRHDGWPRAKPVMSAAGAGWLPGAVVQLAEKWKPRAIVAHDAAPTRLATGVIERAGVKVRKLTGRELADATELQLRRIDDGQFSHDGDPLLEYAFAAVAVRPSEDGAKFTRRHSHGAVAPAIATAVGTFVLDNLPELGPDKPLVVR